MILDTGTVLKALLCIYRCSDRDVGVLSLLNSNFFSYCFSSVFGFMTVHLINVKLFANSLKS